MNSTFKYFSTFHIHAIKYDSQYDLNPYNLYVTEETIVDDINCFMIIWAT